MSDHQGNNSISAISFNQEQTCFSSCTSSGPRIYNVDPLVEKENYNNDSIGTVIICEMLHRTNLLAMVSGGCNPKFDPNKVMVYDDIAQKFVIELDLKAPVKSVRLRRDKLVATTVYCVYIFSFPTPTTLLRTFETQYNPRGLCQISPTLTADFDFVVFPGKKKGNIRLVDLSESIEDRQKIIEAHVHDLAILAINRQGTMIATASLKGTLVRVFDTNKQVLLHELRRGSDTANIYCINFSPSSNFICCASDKGTVHIFALSNTALNQQSSLSAISPVLPGCSYATSQWSYVRFTLKTECPCVCAFRSENAIMAVCVDGSVYKYVFDGNGGVCDIQYDTILEAVREEEV